MSTEFLIVNLFLKIELMFATHVRKYIISWKSLYL